MKCAICGAEFKQRHGSQKYCSEKCAKAGLYKSQKAYKARNREKILLYEKRLRWRKAGLIK